MHISQSCKMYATFLNCGKAFKGSLSPSCLLQPLSRLEWVLHLTHIGRESSSLIAWRCAFPCNSNKNRNGYIFKKCYLIDLTFHVRLFGQTQWCFCDSVGSSPNTHPFNGGRVGFIGYQVNDHGQVSQSSFLCPKKGKCYTSEGFWEN